MIVNNNRDYDSMQSYYHNKFFISVLSQKRIKHDIGKVKATVKAQ